ncbi:hypothetical protein N6H18_03430 [Reichenbachiella agarivorans]|uniref:Outer membrane protein beta-barrel domain-containing protein n=1 Tax=Reichenbachiella agarivorans TaxID=2979464 RepID=A0ABY6CR71_9BACT|nr:hypothetical protein [Reichenbachiella agarivorans]UXP33007.1 hypothetical protein N6H18_03430 [Reichenbachiella agarivorans]
MKLRILIIALVVFAANQMAVGQLLERENVTKTVYNGSRPEEGNFGLTIAAGYAEIKEMIDEDVSFRGFPVLNFNYYFSDNLELVLGAQMYKLSEKFSGSLLDDIGEEADINKESRMRFIPGVNYHFAQSNFLDTYVGLGVILGTEKDEVVTSQRTNLTGDYASDHYTKSSFVSGFNLNIGVRTFVADLPVAIGIEYGLTGVNHSNLQYETVSEASVGGVKTKQTYYTKEVDSALKYKSLEYKKFELGSNVRAVLTYYFRK